MILKNYFSLIKWLEDEAHNQAFESDSLKLATQLHVLRRSIVAIR
jgi:hypothetical protein